MLSTTGVEMHHGFKAWLRKTNAVVAASLSSGGAEAMGRNLALMEMLTELNVPVHEIHGSSAGAPVAAAYSRWTVVPGTEEDMSTDVRTTGGVRRGFLEMARTNNLFDVSRNAIRKLRSTGKASSITGLFAGQRLEDKIEHGFEQATFDQCVKDLYVYAETEEELNFETFSRYSHPELQIHEAVRASISIPHIFEPKTIDEKNYIDGGLLVNTPLRVIYLNYLEKYNKKRPLVIFASTRMYPFQAVEYTENIWEAIKNRYLHKILTRMFFMELAELLAHKNVYVMLFYPQVEPIKSFAFHQLEEYLTATKEGHFSLHEKYLRAMNLPRYRSRLSFKPRYELPEDE